MIADTDYLHTLRLPEPVRREDMERLQISGAQREKLVLQPIEWQMAVAMALHPRLGANSPLHCLEALMVRLCGFLRVHVIAWCECVCMYGYEH